MNKLIPISKFSRLSERFSFLANTLVVVDKKGVPLGFVFGRDAFVSLLETIDTEFEEKVKNKRLAFSNPAGRLIDLIEEKLPVNPNFATDLKTAILSAKKKGWIPFDEIMRTLNV
jgi:hypothetical protein